jgi:Zn-dependent oligopeptidase
MFATKFKSLLTTEPCHGDLEAIVNNDTRAEGRRYRYAVLEPGSSHGSELSLVRTFLGRNPNSKAFVNVLAAASRT